MQLITPKTNWVSDDYVNAEDFNRIRNNLLYLYDESKKYYADYILTKKVENEALYSTYAYAEIWNFIEFTLNDISSNTYTLKDIGTMKEFFPYNFYIDYKELNRIEKAILRYHKMLLGQKNTIPKLSFILGNYREIKV